MASMVVVTMQCVCTCAPCLLLLLPLHHGIDIELRFSTVALNCLCLVYVLVSRLAGILCKSFIGCFGFLREKTFLQGLAMTCSFSVLLSDKLHHIRNTMYQPDVSRPTSSNDTVGVH